MAGWDAVGAAAIGEKIDVAVAQLDRGQERDGREVIASLRYKLQKAKERH
jgi:hypothetical protein